jgi:hypothetical protein
MSFIDIPLKDAKEKEPVPTGEYDLIIEDASLIEDSGKRRVSVRHSIVGEPEAAAVFHNIMLDLPDDEDKRNTSIGFTNAYLDLFEVPRKGTGFDMEELPGSQATCKLGQKEYKGVVSNEIKLRPKGWE